MIQEKRNNVRFGTSVNFDHMYNIYVHLPSANCHGKLYPILFGVAKSLARLLCSTHRWHSSGLSLIAELVYQLELYPREIQAAIEMRKRQTSVAHLGECKGASKGNAGFLYLQEILSGEGKISIFQA